VTYEEGEERLEFAQTSTEYGLGTTTEAARRGQSAGYALLKAGDPLVALGRRAEWSSGIYGIAGTEYSYGISYWLPTDWNQHGVGPPAGFKARIIFQFHEGRDASWSPIYGIQIRDAGDGEKFRFYRKDGPRGPDTDLWTADIVIEQWIDFVINVKWSEGDDGFIRFFRNGELVYEAFGIATLQGRTQPYAKWGIYGEPTRILFDEVRIHQGAPNLQFPD